MTLIIAGLVALTALIVGAAVYFWRKGVRPASFKPNHPLVRWRMASWTYYLWNSLIALMSALVLVAQVLDRKLDPKSAPWIHGAGLQIVLVGALVLVSLIETVRRIWRKTSGSSRSQKRIDIRNLLGAAIATVCHETGVDPGDLGCGLFMLHRRWFRPDFMDRVERVRLLSPIQESGVRFTRDKGTVGQCWTARRWRHHSWTKVNRRHFRNEPSKEKWQSMPANTKHGFEYVDWTLMLGRYSEVLALPVSVAGTFVGCLALDRTWDEAGQDTPDCLNGPAVRKALEGITSLLEPLLKT